MYIEGASLSIFEPTTSGGRPRSYMNAYRHPGGGTAHSNKQNGDHPSSNYAKPSSHVTDIGNSYLNPAVVRGRSLVSPSLSNSESKTLAVDDGYSLHDIDEALEDTVTVQDDDNTTTTSGSYTINAEDLCQEINQLFFNDIVV
ncbi:unnamed protein product [Lymnaea stagnalis]|uniref:Uncharacterized protein n=1 Tax=Lymnaea stagnalis TaxID=6523 RepID=A0AAV2IGX0_LYMST